MSNTEKYTDMIYSCVINRQKTVRYASVTDCRLHYIPTIRESVDILPRLSLDNGGKGERAWERG